MFSFRKYSIQYSIICSLILFIVFLFPQGKVLKYSYQVNDIADEPIIAPFTFSVLKTKQQLNIDLEEQLKSVAFVFNRNDQIVDEQTKKISDFFSMVSDIRISRWRFKESKRLVYERRYHKQYDKAKSEFISDSINLSILTDEFYVIYPFIEKKEDWIAYTDAEQNPENLKDLINDQENIIRICRKMVRGYL